jgi:hypothetical protein
MSSMPIFLHQHDMKMGMVVYNRDGVVAVKDAFSTPLTDIKMDGVDMNSFATVTRGRDQARVKIYGEGVTIYTGHRHG